MREIPIEVLGFEGRNLKIIDNGVFMPYSIFIDGKKAGRKRFKYIVIDNQGKETEIKFIGIPFLEVWKVSINNQIFMIKDEAFPSL